MRKLIVLMAVAVMPGCATLESMAELKSYGRMAEALESVVAAQDSKEEHTGICLDAKDEALRVERVTRLMGWERDERHTQMFKDGFPEETPCIYLRRKPNASPNE